MDRQMANVEKDLAALLARPFLDVYEVATVLHQGRVTTQKMIRDGIIPATKLGGRYKVRTAHLLALFDAAPGGTGAPLSPSSN